MKIPSVAFRQCFFSSFVRNYISISFSLQFFNCPLRCSLEHLNLYVRRKLLAISIQNSPDPFLPFPLLILPLEACQAENKLVVHGVTDKRRLGLRVKTKD